MKIYFENGVLLNAGELPFEPDVYIDACYGYSANLRGIERICKECPEYIVYTNSLVALSSSYAWDKENSRPDIYMRENQLSEFKNIEVLHKGKIRRAQNIEAMYKSGCFGCI